MANGSIIGIPKWIIEKLEEIKKSVSDGKKLVANAITAKGQATAEDATFQTMANNIGNLKPSNYINPSGTLTLSNPTNGTDCTNYASVKTSGLVKPSGTKSITSNGTVDVSAYATASVSVNSDTKHTVVPYLWIDSEPYRRARVGLYIDGVDKGSVEVSAYESLQNLVYRGSSFTV